jgi:hypothetical protein
MGDVKPWQVILIAASLVVLGGSIWFFGLRSTGETRLMANALVLIDVESGQLYEFDLKGRKGVIVPERHPVSGKLSLIPVYQDEAGAWIVGDRDRSSIGLVEVPVLAIDPQSGEVLKFSQQVIRVKN